MKRNRKRKTRTRSRPVLPRFDGSVFSGINIAWSRVATVLVVAIVAMMGHVATMWLLDRPIDSVVINGAFERVTAIQIEETLAPYIQTGFLNADLHGMRAELTNIPWVANASVRRRWPGLIEVQITEQRPSACWGERGLLNVNGELFVKDASHVPVELPRLDGPDGFEAKVTAMYFRIEERLEQRGMAAVSLRLDGRGAWEFELSNGIRVRLGATTVERRLDRFFVALDQVLSSQAEHVDYIDMRYTNGFAIGWKDRNPVRAQTEAGIRPHV
jgi:cell division protein FtsQ